MSRNAYRVKKIVTAKSPSFNLSYDEELVGILEESTDFNFTLNNYGTGIVEITDREIKEVKEKIEELINGLKSTKISQPENREKAKCYRKILAEMEREIAFFLFSGWLVLVFSSPSINSSIFSFTSLISISVISTIPVP